MSAETQALEVTYAAYGASVPIEILFSDYIPDNLEHPTWIGDCALVSRNAFRLLTDMIQEVEAKSSKGEEWLRKALEIGLEQEVAK